MFWSCIDVIVVRVKVSRGMVLLQNGGFCNTCTLKRCILFWCITKQGSLLIVAIISCTQNFTIENLKRLCSYKIIVQTNIVSRWSITEEKKSVYKLEVF